ncbi:hypothetical protein [Bordetella bronchiseptica]|uniref:hypothetical protein n=1 Tax=Bordetella bronchiseptica TaxID=518 RepID=UPI0012471A5F|nr:hypothetical protein [Bordetella bronchiseptica]KAB1444164.1 hypothetical protein F7D00_21115 [Bordetella bronchiseptica]KAB1569270.1 hypothetical protein F7890_21115 [Bordetella bronchiseptica]
MTTQNNAAQPVLTDEELREIQGTHLVTIRSREALVASVIVAGRAIEQAVLSKLRAPVADERDFEDEAHDRDNYLAAQTDERDAQRYRWLRDQNDWCAEPRIDETDGTVWKLTFYTSARIEDPTDDDSLDTAVDAARSALASAPVAEPVQHPKREDVTPEMRAGFERLFSEARKRRHGTLARNEQGAYRNLWVAADWVFYQRAWADALASAPVAGEAQQPVALVEVSVPHLRSISVKIIPGAPMPNIGDMLYAAPQGSADTENCGLCGRKQLVNTAPTAAEGGQASEAVRNEGLKRARKLPEVKCSNCGLKVVSSCGSTGCPVKDRYADLRALSAQPGAIRNPLIAEPSGNPGELERAGDAPREGDLLTIAYLAGAQAEKERAALAAQAGAKKTGGSDE